MTWLGIVKAALIALSAFASWLRNRALIDAGAAEAVAAHLAGALDEIGRAQAARDSVRDVLLRHPDRVRDDDEFRRD